MTINEQMLAALIMVSESSGFDDAIKLDGENEVSFDQETTNVVRHAISVAKSD